MIIAVELISRIAQQHFLPLIRKPQSILDRIMKQKSTLKPQIRCIRHFPKKKSIILNNALLYIKFIGKRTT